MSEGRACSFSKGTPRHTVPKGTCPHSPLGTCPLTIRMPTLQRSIPGYTSHWKSRSARRLRIYPTLGIAEGFSPSSGSINPDPGAVPFTRAGCRAKSGTFAAGGALEVTSLQERTSDCLPKIFPRADMLPREHQLCLGLRVNPLGPRRKESLRILSY